MMLDIQDVMDELEERYDELFDEENGFWGQVCQDIVSMDMAGKSKEEIVAKYPMSDDEWDCLKADIERSKQKWDKIIAEFRQSADEWLQ